MFIGVSKKVRIKASTRLWMLRQTFPEDYQWFKRDEFFAIKRKVGRVQESSITTSIVKFPRDPRRYILLNEWLQIEADK